VRVAVVPLSKKEELIKGAQKIVQMLRGRFRVEYDQMGRRTDRRYRRHDEIGTPFRITVDFETLADQAVTVRHRDATAQERAGIALLWSRLKSLAD